MTALRIEVLTPKLWPAFEKLFGERGACAGCWCMFWRLDEGEKFSDVQGAEAKRRMKKLVATGNAVCGGQLIEGADVADGGTSSDAGLVDGGTP